MELLEALEQIGLSKKESEAYLHLLRLGTQPASVIAKRMNIPRSTAHFLLENLVNRRMAKLSKKANSFLFTPEPPQNLIHILENEREQLLEQKDRQLNLIKGINHLFQGLMLKYTDIPKVTFYEGIEACLEMFHEKDAKKPVNSYIFSASNYVAQKHSKEIQLYLDIHNQARKETKKHDYVIDSQSFTKQNQKRNPARTDFRYFPDKSFVLKTHLQIDGDHVGILNIENHPIGISIEHAALAEDFRQLHQQFWKALEPTPAKPQTPRKKPKTR